MTDTFYARHLLRSSLRFSNEEMMVTTSIDTVKALVVGVTVKPSDALYKQLRNRNPSACLSTDFDTPIKSFIPGQGGFPDSMTLVVVKLNTKADDAVCCYALLGDRPNTLQTPFRVHRDWVFFFSEFASSQEKNPSRRQQDWDLTIKRRTCNLTLHLTLQIKQVSRERIFAAFRTVTFESTGAGFPYTDADAANFLIEFKIIWYKMKDLELDCIVWLRRCLEASMLAPLPRADLCVFVVAGMVKYHEDQLRPASFEVTREIMYEIYRIRREDQVEEVTG